MTCRLCFPAEGLWSLQVLRTAGGFNLYQATTDTDCSPPAPFPGLNPTHSHDWTTPGRFPGYTATENACTAPLPAAWATCRSVTAFYTAPCRQYGCCAVTRSYALPCAYDAPALFPPSWLIASHSSALVLPAAALPLPGRTTYQPD